MINSKSNIILWVICILVFLIGMFIIIVLVIKSDSIWKKTDFNVNPSSCEKVTVCYHVFHYGYGSGRRQVSCDEVHNREWEVCK
jgi:hypothetical protein